MVISELFDIIKCNDAEKLACYMRENDLFIQDGSIFSKNKQKINDMEDYWDKRQLVRKIMLNCVYGSLTNKGSKFFDQRMGQSCTLTGRCITRHIGNVINEMFLGEDYENHSDKNICLYFDTDSFPSDTLIHTENGQKTVGELFDNCSLKYTHDRKQFGIDNINVLTYDNNSHNIYYKPLAYVYRHKVSKKRFRICDNMGNSVDVTEDHSIMIERDGKLLSLPSRDIKVNDIMITVNK